MIVYAGAGHIYGSLFFYSNYRKVVLRNSKDLNYVVKGVYETRPILFQYS
jgi:hypothetical protein